MLRESEEKFRLLVDEVRDYAIFFLDPEGRVMTWNAGAERIKGYRADEIIGQSFVRFYLPKDVVAGVPSRLLRRATEQGVATDEGVRVRKDGSRFWASVVLTALHDKSGRLRGFAKVTRDITEQKHAEQSMAILADASRRWRSRSIRSRSCSPSLAWPSPPLPTEFRSITRDPQGEPRLGLFHAANPELLAAVHELQRKGTYRVAAPSRRVMRTGRSELHPKVTPEWLLAQGTNDELTPHDSEVWHPLAHLRPDHLGGRPFRRDRLRSGAPPRVYNEHDPWSLRRSWHGAHPRRCTTRSSSRPPRRRGARRRGGHAAGTARRNRRARPAQPALLDQHGGEHLSSSALATAEEELVSRIQRSASRMARMIVQILDFARIRSGQSFEPARVRRSAPGLPRCHRRVTPQQTRSRDRAEHRRPGRRAI